MIFENRGPLYTEARETNRNVGPAAAAGGRGRERVRAVTGREGARARGLNWKVGHNAELSTA